MRKIAASALIGILAISVNAWANPQNQVDIPDRTQESATPDAVSVFQELMANTKFRVARIDGRLQIISSEQKSASATSAAFIYSQNGGVAGFSGDGISVLLKAKRNADGSRQLLFFDATNNRLTDAGVTIPNAQLQSSLTRMEKKRKSR